MRNYFEIYQQYLDRQPAISESMAQKMIVLGDETANEALLAFGYMNSGVALTNMHNYSEASMNLSMAIEKYKKLNMERELAHVHNMKSLVFKSQSKFDDATSLVQEALRLTSPCRTNKEFLIACTIWEVLPGNKEKYRST